MLYPYGNSGRQRVKLNAVQLIALERIFCVFSHRDLYTRRLPPRGSAIAYCENE